MMKMLVNTARAGAGRRRAAGAASVALPCAGVQRCVTACGSACGVPACVAAAAAAGEAAGAGAAAGVAAGRSAGRVVAYEYACRNAVAVYYSSVVSTAY